MGKQWHFLSLGSKITADCCHKIKRCLLLGRKAMTNLDNVLKSRDITLSTMVHIVKIMVFPVVIYRSELNHTETWVPKNWSFRIVVLEKTLESPLDSKKIKPVHPKGNQLWIFIGRTDTEALILWPPDVRSQLIGRTLMLVKIEGRRRMGWQRMKWLITSSTQWTWVWANLRR